MFWMLFPYIYLLTCNFSKCNFPHLCFELLSQTFYIHFRNMLFRNKRFILDQMLQQNVSKFAIILEKENPSMSVFSFHSLWMFWIKINQGIIRGNKVQHNMKTFEILYSNFIEHKPLISAEWTVARACYNVYKSEPFKKIRKNEIFFVLDKDQRSKIQNCLPKGMIIE